MTEIPEHLRRRAEEARRHTLGETNPPFADRLRVGATPPPEPPQITPVVRHEVATIIVRNEAPSTCFIVCTCGWVSDMVWIPNGITVAFHQHARGRT